MSLRVFPLIAALALSAPAFAQHAAHHDLSQRWLPTETRIVLPVSACDVGEAACAVVLPETAGGGQLVAEITPRPVEPLTPFAISVKTEGLAVSAIQADFSGVKMDMGPNEVALKAAEDGKSFTGKATIPVCRSGKMRWQMTLLVSAGDKTLVVPFQFSAAR
ncbi:MAG: hypothetical protein LBL69_02505 [Zoogloeaceae bacterium]|nr:hypothetical protein [Zoogloeaceae bacterium]